MDINNSKDKIELILKTEQKDDGEISLRDIINTILKGKWIIVVAVILIPSVVFGYLKFTAPIVAKTIISFNFEGIEKGVDPNGKNFDVSIIKSPSIINEVIKKIGLDKKGINIGNIVPNIDIQPIIPGDISEKIKKIQQAKSENIKDQQDFVYYPNTYIVSFNVSKNSKISVSTAKSILDEVIHEYANYFFQTYTDRNAIANSIGKIKYDEYDYPEITAVMHNQINILENYLTAKLKQRNGDIFRSTKHGVSFSDIIGTIDVIDKTDIGRLDAIIGAYNLTKDKDNLIKLYEYRIKQNELLKNKKDDEAKIVSDMLGKYQKDKNLVMLPGSADMNSETGMFEFNKTDDYYNQLAERYTNSGVESKNAQHDIEYYQKEIEKFKSDSVTQSQKVIAEKQVIKMIPDVADKLKNWVDITNDTVDEYYNKYFIFDAIKVITTAQNVSFSYKFQLLIAFAAALILSLVVVFFMEYWKRNYSKDNIVETE
ncbi:hypothetical protein [Pseudobacteroides cellulosolvens]|uniref:Lipopolysaccharide biosynthesis protein n=1 Tax=Pseudobacteroides cellulosolvens ATCC 35603 = DSM 2933 TaxID=398512 RepID=A0A0L6JM60_9FIRM|nr:hypothetical protein [Pseudobacteroides cellulosolvens]KNY26835.1 hypothetical protein Bccel_2100 [Pseudobacteroides cellulosolvens ATCC 35603 = DSM 2933]